MATTTEHIIRRVQKTRKCNGVSTGDCATLLGVSKKAYRKIEEGIKPLTLSQLELLAIYFGVTPAIFFSDEPDLPPKPPHEKIRQGYINLRDKMLRSMLMVQREKQGISLDELSDATSIPHDRMKAYEDGDSPIPLPDLLNISDSLKVPINALYEVVWLPEDATEQNLPQQTVQPEFEGVSSENHSHGENPYTHLELALHKLPMDDQARIAKSILSMLRSH